MKQRRVLILDIETAPMLAYVFDRKEQYIRPDQIRDDWFVLAWSAKWLGNPDITYRSQQKASNLANDKKILTEIRDLLNEAEVVITQNGERFDGPKLNARFILQGLRPPSPYTHYDTCKLASKVAKFTSNSLEYLADKLNVKYKKLKHRKFPGMKLWKECLAGNKSAWDEMKIYNIRDVLATEELFFTLRAWAPQKFPQIFDITDEASQCSTCGYEGYMREGKLRKTRKLAYRQHQCPKCGSWQQGVKVSINE